ncbi:MAG TPA: gamma-glutamyltranspeptidase [Solibacterales bacterium]|nr:gamma-glutamyltranspeptidase [Bryobacterales bacterium]
MRFRFIPLALVTLLVCFGQRKETERPAARQAVRGMRGAVGAGTDYAAEAGMRVFAAGGNAVDAGVATMFAASVVEFSHFGFGGEAPILIRTRDGKVVALAGVGTMPKLASSDFFRKRKMRAGEVLIMERNGLEGMVPAAGMMPVLVPGMVEAGLVALREYGSKSFTEVIAHAAELCDGMALDETRAGSILRSRRWFDLWPSSKAVFLPEDFAPMPGANFRQPDLARTLRAMAAAEQQALKTGASREKGIDAVRDFFYRGEIARKIDAFSREHEGLIRYEDLAAFRLKPEPAVSTTYRGYTVHKPGFWSQGPAMIQTLNMLEGVDLEAMGHNSVEYVHTLTETLKLAYADRDTYYGDPNFVEIPADRLLSRDYAAQRRKGIGEDASMEFRPGNAGGKPRRHPAQVEMVRLPIDDALMARDTTCVSAIDKDGMIFSATPSGAWLPSVIVEGTGIPLTQRAQSFLLVEGHPNELAGGKRPRVTLSPTLVTRDGKPFASLTTPGGDNQDQALLQLLFNVTLFGMDAQKAAEAPRFQTRHLVSSFDNHAMNPGDLLLDERIHAALAPALSARGHKVGRRSRWNSGAAPVLVRVIPDGVIEAGADPYGYRVARAW